MLFTDVLLRYSPIGFKRTIGYYCCVWLPSSDKLSKPAFTMNESKNDTPVNMSSILTSPNVAQYLHPDYLQPLPTTLDAKKSPLALLAQTCSSIGKDPSPSKSIIPPFEKDKKDTEKSGDKSAASESRKSPGSDNSNDSSQDLSKKPGFRSVPPKEIPPLVPISSSVSSRKSSPAPASTSETKKSSETTTVTTSVTKPVSSTGGSGGSSTSNIRSSNSAPLERDRDRDSDRERERERNKDNNSEGKSVSRSSPEHFSSSSASKYPGPIPGLNGLSGLPHPGLSLYGHGYPLDPASVSSAYASSLAAAGHPGYSLSASAAAALAAQNAALSKQGALSAGLSPYVSYARVRTPSGATTLVPVCRDPFCTNCQLTLQNSHVSSTCTAPGCPQCAHEKSLQSLSVLGMAGASSLSMLPQFSTASSLPSGLSSYPGLTPSLYAHSLLGATAAHSQGLPYVCNWVSGTDYCGKRFSTSEELLQHLRTHTSGSDSASSLAGYASLGLPPMGLSGYPHAPLPAHGGLSPNSLRRAYPTIPSPLSSVLNGSRYHPYKSPLSNVPSALQPGQPLSTLGPYYSPYSLYGQRIGAAAVP